MKLGSLHAGQTCHIKKVGGQGALRRRLLDMGLTPATAVCIRKLAPMGDPIQMTLRGYELTLRKEDADQIEVELLAPQCAPYEDVAQPQKRFSWSAKKARVISKAERENSHEQSK